MFVFDPPMKNVGAIPTSDEPWCTKQVGGAQHRSHKPTPIHTRSHTPEIGLRTDSITLTADTGGYERLNGVKKPTLSEAWYSDLHMLQSQ